MDGRDRVAEWSGTASTGPDSKSQPPEAALGDLELRLWNDVGCASFGAFSSAGCLIFCYFTTQQHSHKYRQNLVSERAKTSTF